MAGEWLVQMANFENVNIVLLLNFIFVSENHITVVAVGGSRQAAGLQEPGNIEALQEISKYFRKSATRASRLVLSNLSYTCLLKTMFGITKQH